MSDRRVKHERRRTARPNSRERRLLADRRRKKRYRVKEGAYAALINKDNRLGQIRDISLVGLSFRYIASNDKFNPNGELKIILAGSGLFMDNLPVKPVSDFEVDNDYAFSSLKIRQMHLAFGDLTPQQLSMLDHFILNHTMGEA
jgi:hypothetical protein